VEVPRWAPGGPLEDRYASARAAYDEQVGGPLVRAYNWRLACFASMAITMVSVVGLIVQSTKSSVVPYIVEVGEGGQVRLVGEVAQKEWSIGESARQGELGRWVRHLRSMPLDQHVFKERLADVQARSTQAARVQLAEYVDQNDPYAGLGQLRRTVEIGTFTRVNGSADVWRVEWVERTHDTSGALTGTAHMIGEFELVVTAPTDAGTLTYNPLGVWVSYFDITERPAP
jgi:type IV secretion system protein VirB5